MTNAEVPVCNSCGRCCQKGGPALHSPDRQQVETGTIPLDCLFTIRKGEPVFENVKEKVDIAEEEIVRVRNSPDKGGCIFLSLPSICTIYPYRPGECRALFCNDPDSLKNYYRKDRLSRKDILSENQGVYELIQVHNQKCDVEYLREMVFEWRKKNRASAKEQVLELIRYDEGFRSAAAEKTGYSGQLLEFLLGRKTSHLVRAFETCMEEI